MPELSPDQFAPPIVHHVIGQVPPEGQNCKIKDLGSAQFQWEYLDSASALLRSVVKIFYHNDTKTLRLSSIQLTQSVHNEEGITRVKKKQNFLEHSLELNIHIYE